VIVEDFFCCCFLFIVYGRNKPVELICGAVVAEGFLTVGKAGVGLSSSYIGRGRASNNGQFYKEFIILKRLTKINDLLV
jgi:hypothetical protein